jgi:hypothetical protein
MEIISPGGSKEFPEDERRWAVEESVEEEEIRSGPHGRDG